MSYTNSDAVQIADYRLHITLGHKLYISAISFGKYVEKNLHLI